MKLTMYLMPHKFDISGFYFFLIAVSIFDALRKIRAQKRSATPWVFWWMECTSFGLGIGIYALTILPDASLINIPLLILTAFVTTILTNDLVKRLKKRSA